MLEHELDPKRADIIAMLERGKTCSQVAEAFSVSKGVFMGWAYRRRIAVPRKGIRARPTPSDDREDILRRYEVAVDRQRFLRVISARYGITLVAVRAWFRENGVTDLPRGDDRGGKPTPKVKSEPLPPALAAAENRPGVPFLDATADQCRFPLWGIDEKTGDVCGRSVKVKKVRGKIVRMSWCAGCASRVSRPFEAIAA